MGLDPGLPRRPRRVTWKRRLELAVLYVGVAVLVGWALLGVVT